MKKFLIRIFIVSGLCLSASCGKVTAGPTGIPTQSPVPIEETEPPKPTETSVPTKLPKLSSTPEPTEPPEPSSTPEPTEPPEPSSTPEPTEPSSTPEPTEPPEPSSTPEPTEPSSTPEPTEPPEPSSTPEPTEPPKPSSTPEPTEPPKPSSTPEPTETLEPSSTPKPTETPIPTPTVAPEFLVLNGWQKTKSIEDDFFIIFPDFFQDSYLKKTELELLVGYTSSTHTEVEFQVVYRLQQTLEEAEESVLLADGKLQKEPSENRTAYMFLQEEKIHQGYLYEMQYSRELLGSAFGDEEQITGVMWVEFSYPESRSEEYQQEQYRFYVIKNREDE